MTIYAEGAVCDVSRPLVSHQEVPVMPNPKSLKNNLPELYKAIRAAKKNRSRRQFAAALRRCIVWNDIPEDIIDILNEWAPLE